MLNLNAKNKFFTKKKLLINFHNNNINSNIDNKNSIIIIFLINIIYFYYYIFSSFFDLKRGPKVTFFYRLDKKNTIFAQRALIDLLAPTTLTFRKIAEISLNPL